MRSYDTVAVQLKAVQDNHTASGSNDSQPAMLGTETKSSEAYLTLCIRTYVAKTTTT